MSTGDDVREDWVLVATSNDKRAKELVCEIRSHTTWAVKRVRSGGSAIRALAQYAPTVAFVDSDLPILSCDELVYIVRRRPATADVALLVVEFGRLDRSREAAVLAAGADEYVDGKVRSGIWTRAETVLMRRHVRGESAQSPIRSHRIDGLYVDVDNLLASVNGAAIMMQPLEFALLEYLLKRKNCLVTREELWHAVWHKDGPVRSRTIDVHICRLRRRLGSVAPRIQTLVRWGYRFVDDAGA